MFWPVIEECFVQRIFSGLTPVLINMTISLFVYLLNYRPCTSSLDWAGGCDWDYSLICICSHSASWEFDIDRGPCLLLVCFVHGLLYLGRDKVVCQTQGKTNKPDSGSIYILLCNSLDLFFVRHCGFIAEINHLPVNITTVLVYFVQDNNRRKTTCQTAGATSKDW